MMKKIIDKTLIILGTGLSILFLLSLITKLEFISPTIRNVSLLVTIFIFVFLILKILKAKISEKVNRIVFFSSILTGLFIISVTHRQEAWKTQRIIYHHGHFNFLTIELQTRNKSTTANDRRIVKVTKIAGFLRIIEPIDTTKVGIPWFKVDEKRI